jgi:O-antigen/teichoic acid export membrane protein
MIKTKISSLKSSLRGRKVLTKILENIAWLLVDKVIRFGITMVISVLVARYLGPEKYGILSYAGALTFLVLPLATLSFDPLIVRELSQKEGKITILGNAFTLRFISSLLCIALLILFSILNEKDTTAREVIMVSSLSLIFYSAYVIDLYYQSFLKNSISVLVFIFGVIISSAIKILFILTKKDVVFFAFANITEQIISATAFIIVFRTREKVSFPKFSLSVSKGILFNSLPLIAVGVMNSIQARIDQVFINNMISSRELGYYSAALKIIEILSSIPMVLFQVSLPPIAEAKKVNEEIYISRLKRVYRAVITITFGFCIITAVFSRQIIDFVFGKEYELSSTFLMLLGPRLVLSGIGVVRGIFITCENAFYYYLISSAVGAILNLIFNLTFIPKFGVVGAIASSLISFTISTVVLDVLFPKMRKNLKIIAESLVPFRWR